MKISRRDSLKSALLGLVGLAGAKKAVEPPPAPAKPVLNTPVPRRPQTHAMVTSSTFDVAGYVHYLQARGVVF